MAIDILDRSITPAFQTIQEVFIPPVKNVTLSNGLPLHIINVGEQPIIKLELIFNAGNWFDDNKGISFFTAKMLNEGTSAHNSASINQFFDQYGAFTEFTHSVDRASFVLYGLSKHLGQLLPMVQEILQDSIFPQKELDTIKKIQQQTIQVNQEKTSFVANQKIRNSIFGETHPYGTNLTQEVIESITRENLVKYYQSHWQNQPFRIFLSGKITEQEIEVVNNILGSIPVGGGHTTSYEHTDGGLDATSFLIEKENALQSSIRLGKQLFTRSHPDYFNMLIVNEVLGGYFGSRLMKNIREEKGLTYGIGSNVVPFSKNGYFIVGTDVKKEFTQLTIDEIIKEIQVLRTELVSEEELSTVRNYMSGAFAGSLNTPFEIADRYKVIMSEQLPLDFYQQYFQHIQQITSEDILEAAQKHLDPASLIEVAVGGK
ncbi:pitrilysin family protein [Flectobacillus sp. BAB-3569]|uniref:M16 family metallopeptidase n=1 Tax=Flectobacillus sp. BAB-3569 TaxID=1509483 RepID=UPI000BA425B4|nr:pitrilysin family protein [Flectobacillus sp. BAB-3569]PAC33682.1 peptidase M16 [Flectobacillus sp. BAB-3569]